jgi:hypothetical protein
LQAKNNIKAKEILYQDFFKSIKQENIKVWNTYFFQVHVGMVTKTDLISGQQNKSK